MYTEHKAKHYARTPRAMGMPGIPYVLEYVLEYFVQEVCQEYLMLNVGEYYHVVPHYSNLVVKIKIKV